MAAIEVKVPDIGDFKDVAVIELLVKPGDSVKAEQCLITVESDKASMEIPSSHAGVVKELKVKVGDKVNEGTVVLVLESGRRGGSRCSRRRRPRRHPRRRPQCLRPRRWPRATPAAPTSSATCSCSAPARAATRPPSAPPTSA